MRPDVLCMGEAIIDLHALERGGLGDASRFLKTLGGAPANLAIGLARLGISTGFVGAVGDDPFGRFIVRTLEKERVGTGWVTFKQGRRTRLAFIAHDERGEPEFVFWEQFPADASLAKKDLPRQLIADAKAIHISSFLLLTPRLADLAMWLADRAVAAGVLVSFDPNIRMRLWPSPARALTTLRKMTRHVAVFRGNAREGEFITQTRSPEAAVDALLAIGPQLVVLTDGRRGCYFGTRRSKGFVPAFRVKTVDGTGCGDGFTAALLAGVVRNGGGIAQLAAHELAGICEYANAVGALVATKSGGAASMPPRRTVERFLAQRRKGATSSRTVRSRWIDRDGV